MKEPTPDLASPGALELPAVRERLRHARGPEFWRSLEELSGSPEFQELLHREFPRQAAEWPSGVDRRRFLQLMAASLALGGLTACTRQPLEKIVPYVEQPELIVPGKPLYFATAMTLGGCATPLLAESHMGRPTKVEGNPEHPAGGRGTDLFAQASVLGLYDPDRSQVVKELGRIRTWQAFFGELRRGLRALEALGGARLRILTGTVTSPTLAATLGRVLAAFPRSRWHQYEPAARHGARAAALAAYGEPLETRYDFGRARVVLALDADFLGGGPGFVPYARDFMRARQVREGEAEMNRLYAVESAPTSTGACADHRLAVAPSRVAAFARAVAAELGVAGVDFPAQAFEGNWVGAVARDLAHHRGSSLVVAGDCAGAEVHLLAAALNRELGNLGSTAILTDPVEAEPVDQIASLSELVAEMKGGEVDVLLVLGGNPVYDAPADLGFREALLQVNRRVRLGLYEDETSEFCHWHLPQAHYLESWGDARAYEGTVSLIQPLIEPLYGGKTAAEVLAGLIEEPEPPGDELLRRHWSGLYAGQDFDSEWRRWLHDGFVPGTAAPRREAEPRPLAATLPGSTTEPPEGLELALRPDPTLYDGRFSNNGWLQECPKPLTKLTWDNAALISPALARSLDLENGQMVEIAAPGRLVEVPVWIAPGQPEGAVTLHLGSGRTRTGRVGSGTGFDVYPLRTSAELWSVAGAVIHPRSGIHPLASTQLHNNIELEGREAEKRHLVREGTLDEFRADPEFAHHLGHGPAEHPSIYPPVEYEGHAWGLAVDLSACSGCNACVVACQAENNIPVVGKEQVLIGREMHWIRIDRYYRGEPDRPEVLHQPVMCMHCEQAPCEVVCPVAATVHSDEGLNDMVYNRCVGTRYCSNNCPYKVRRFNFLLYSDFETPVREMMRNPDVTVRSRGVMEKCTYCVQRISHARIEARKERRPIRDGEILTACQQVCPTEAIAFGDVNDPGSEVSRWKAAPLNYGILEELNTRPRTSYLARLRNPNPELEEGSHHGA